MRSSQTESPEGQHPHRSCGRTQSGLESDRLHIVGLPEWSGLVILARMQTSGPAALVTGASSGIGEAVARSLSSRGFRVVSVTARHYAKWAGGDTYRERLEVDED